MTKENTFVITEADLGDYMGAVDASADERQKSASVYHFAPYNNDSSICIVENKGSYAFYVFSHMISAQKEGINSGGILNAYGIRANKTIKIRVSDSKDNSIKKITNINHISAILNILST